MKRTIRFSSLLFLAATMLWSCTKNENLPSGSLKMALSQGALELNTAVDKITGTQAYPILTISDGTLKSETITDSTYRVYIGLDQIKGVYEYKPVNFYDRWGFSLIRYFKRTADNEQMIVKMPLKKVKNPFSLRHFSPADSTLTNNFTIAVSDYYNNYNSYWDYEYLLDSKISIDDVQAGSLYMKSLVSPLSGRKYESRYSFEGGYTARYNFKSGDTTVFSFGILDGDEILYEEKRIVIKSDTAPFGREHQYILTIGNVQITRIPATHTVEVSVDGVVQPGATVTVVDKVDEQEPSVTNKREIQITFEDGTTTTISALIGDSVGDLRTIFRSLHQVYFAASVVDWIAYDIYYHRN